MINSNEPDLKHENVIVNIVEVLTSTIAEIETKGVFKLNETEVKFIKQLMKNSPDSFAKISTDINEIVNKRQVEITDIPHLIYLIASIYINDLKYENINIIDCIQFTLNAILDSGILPINKVSEEVIQAIINSSLNLLKTNLPIIEEKIELIATSLSKRIYHFLSRLMCFC